MLLDDLKARRFAHRVGQPCMGTVGLLLRAKEIGAIETIAAPLASLADAGLHLGRTLVHEALALAGE